MTLVLLLLALSIASAYGTRKQYLNCIQIALDFMPTLKSKYKYDSSLTAAANEIRKQKHINLQKQIKHRYLKAAGFFFLLLITTFVSLYYAYVLCLALIA